MGDMAKSRMDEVLTHYACTFQTFNFHFHFQSYSASLVIRTSIIRILDYSNEPDGRLRHCKTCLRMHNLPTVVGVADFHSVRSSRDCGPIAAVSFTEDMTKSKRKRKALSIINDKVSIVKQLKNSSFAIIAERYGL